MLGRCKVSLQVVGGGYWRKRGDAVMRGWRWLNRMIAKFCGYFWLPCPICGEPFGGHESRGGHLMVGLSSGIIVCYKDKCIREAEQRNNEANEFGALR